MRASVRVLEIHYVHLVQDAEETARAKRDVHAAASVWALSGVEAKSTRAKET